LTVEHSGTWSATAATSRARPSSGDEGPYLAAQSTPCATSSPASATPAPARASRRLAGVSPPAVVIVHMPATARETAAAGTANGSAWSAG
jgi:hypothetical protein